VNLSETNPVQLKLTQLQEELRKFQNQNFHNWRLYVVAILYAFVAWTQSSIQALILYSGTVALIFMVHERSERRNKQQMKLIAELIDELQKQKN